MSSPIVVPIEAYRDRAANAPEPASHNAQISLNFRWEDLNVHNPDQARELAATSVNYYADVSEFQQPYNSSYAYPIREFRCDSGNREDKNCLANWQDTQRALSNGTCELVFIYPVFVPGNNNAIMSRIKNRFGSTTPTNRLAALIDMESGSNFAGPGDHSVEANALASMLADYTGEPVDMVRSHGYGNLGDLASNWPHILPQIMQHRAAYNAINPGGFAWQYQGGNTSYPAPTGAPRSFAPFGTYVDGNLIFDTLDNIKIKLGITKPLVEDDDMSFRCYQQPGDPAQWAIGNLWAIQADSPAQMQQWQTMSNNLSGTTLETPDLPHWGQLMRSVLFVVPKDTLPGSPFDVAGAFANLISTAVAAAVKAAMPATPPALALPPGKLEGNLTWVADSVDQQEKS